MKKIVCPGCGAEYLPAEVLYPNSLLGKPTNINKNANGKIIDYSGQSMELEETYVCDYCNRKMHINCDINFSVEFTPFKSDYVTKFKRPSLFLSEEE